MTNDSLIGKKLANFQVERLLAHGGMAEVYYGWDVNLQRPVAIKVIDARFRKNPSYAQRFISEARAMAAWRHENIVQVYYADQQDDLYYFVMEYVDGVGLDVLLRQYAEKGEYLPYPDVLHIGRAVANALDYAHRRGVIHRDVKPPNVMVSTDNRVMLMDFGLALDTHQGSIGEVFGTPHYIAPEQARRSADATPLSDVYSLGVMLYEMLTGTVPFDDPSATSVAILHLSEPPPLPRSLNPQLSTQVEAVLLKALEKDPQNRYDSTVALIQALEKALAMQKSEHFSLELPPLPAGMAAPDKKQWQPTLAERVSLLKQQMSEAGSPQTLVAAQLPHTSPTRPKPPMRLTTLMDRRRRPRPWIWLILVSVVIVIGLVFALSSRDNGVNLGVIASAQTETAVVIAQAFLPTHTPTDAPTDLPPSETPSPEPTASDTPTNLPPSETAAPTVTPTPSATRTPLRLVTNTIEPTSTYTPTSTPTATPSITPTPTSLTPTVMYPDGPPIVMSWNNTSFYLYNPNRFAIQVQPLVFEALATDGTPTEFALRGERWMIGFVAVEAGKCSAVELLDRANYLRPEACQTYNAILTLPPDSTENFFVRRDGVTHFRVIWQGDEVARCRIADRACTVRLP
jgi:serine/threonine protein kinase